MMPMTARTESAGRNVLDGVGEERQGEAQEAVGPHLQQDRGQEDRAGGRRLDVGVGQPGVEREERAP